MNSVRYASIYKEASRHLQTTPAAPANEASRHLLDGRSHPSLTKEGSSPERFSHGALMLRYAKCDEPLRGVQREMRQHNNLAMRRGFREERYLTERQFLRFAGNLQEDRMTKREMIYTKFERFEEQLGHCYFLLHERFITNPPLARFWAEAAMDELQHQSILRFCRDRGLMADVDLDGSTAEHVEQLLETAKGL